MAKNVKAQTAICGNDALPCFPANMLNFPYIYVGAPSFLFVSTKAT